MYPLKRFAFSGILSFLFGLAAADTFETQIGSVFLIFFAFISSVFFCREFSIKIIFLVTFSFALGFCYMNGHLIEAPFDDKRLNHPIEASIVLKEVPLNRGILYGNVVRLDEKILDKPLSIRIQKKWGDETLYQRGGTYSFKGVISKPLAAVNPGGFDDYKFLKTRGIFYSLKALQNGKILLPPNNIMSFFNNLRSQFEAIYDQYLLPQESNLLKGALFGEKGALDEDFYALSQKMGIAHVFAVSGLHIGFIMGLCFLILRGFSLEKSWLGIAFLIIILSSYVFLVGGVPSAVRASVLLVMTLLLQKFLFYKDALTILGWVFFVLSLFNPFVIWNIGAQLSFGIAISIIYVYPLLRPYLPSKKFKILWDGVGVSLASEIVSIPLAAWYFYIWAPYGIFFNCIVIPIFSILIPLAIIGLGVSFIVPFLAKFVFYLVHLLIQFMFLCLNFITGIIGSGHIYVGKPSGLWLTIFLIFICGGTLLNWRYYQVGKTVNKSFLKVSGIVFIILLFTMGKGASPSLAFSVLDVGQGASAVYQSPKGEWFVFDTGPNKDTTAQFLRYSACNKIKAIILSHGDNDHVKGLKHLLRDFKVEHLLISEKIIDSPAFQESIDLLNKGKTKVHFINQVKQLKLDKDCFLQLDLVDQSEESNSHEVVAFLKERDFSWLIPGDTEGRALEEIIFQEPVQILLVPHHGSKNSWKTAFYNRYQPDLAIISAGRENRFGHPHKVVLEGLEEMNIPYCSTSKSGAILFWREGKELLCEPFLK